MSADAISADAATTDWRTYDGPVPAKFTFYIIVLPLLMVIFILLPTLACYFCLWGGERGKVAQYYPPNRRMRGFHDSRSPFHGNLEHGFQGEKF